MPVSGKAGAFGKAGEWAASVVLTMIGQLVIKGRPDRMDADRL